MKPNKLNGRLRKTVKKMMIDRDLEWSGSYLAAQIGCNRNSLSMAISGYRSGPASVRILKELRQYLKTA